MTKPTSQTGSTTVRVSACSAPGRVGIAQPKAQRTQRTAIEHPAHQVATTIPGSWDHPPNHELCSFRRCSRGCPRQGEDIYASAHARVSNRG